MKDQATIIADTETGGVEPQHPTIQLAAIAVRGWMEIDCFERKIRFDVAQAEPEALKLNSYDASTWKAEAIGGAVAIQNFDEWLRGYCEVEKVSKSTGNPYKVARVAGWNVRFDCERIERGFKAMDKFLPAATFEALDLMQVARGYFWDRSEHPENMKLSTVAKWFGLEIDGAHDALADCRLTLEIARRILQDHE